MIAEDLWRTACREAGALHDVASHRIMGATTAPNVVAARHAAIRLVMDRIEARTVKAKAEILASASGFSVPALTRVMSMESSTVERRVSLRQAAPQAREIAYRTGVEKICLIEPRRRDGNNSLARFIYTAALSLLAPHNSMNQVAQFCGYDHTSVRHQWRRLCAKYGVRHYGYGNRADPLLTLERLIEIADEIGGVSPPETPADQNGG